MALDRLISTRITEVVTDDASPTSSTTRIVREDRLVAEALGNRFFVDDIVRGFYVTNSKAVYRVRFVDWLIDADLSRVEVTDRHGRYIHLDAIREDHRNGRRRFLILEGEAF